MNGDSDSTGSGNSRQTVVEAAIRFGLLALLLVTCFWIVAPFVVPVLWGTILAVATYPAFCRLSKLLGGRERLAAALLVVAAFAILIVPVLLTSASMVEGMRAIAGVLEHGGLKVPPPPDRVADWPVVGGTIHGFWALASENLEAAFTKLEPQLKVIGGWLAGAIGGFGVGVLEFVVSIFIAGVFLAGSATLQRMVHTVAHRIAGTTGHGFVQLSAATVRSVAQGVLGVAIVQGVLAAIGMFAAGVPAAEVWALLIVVLAVVQLPSLIVLAPVALYVFSAKTTTVAVVFGIWCLVVGSSDNLLKPLLMGRGLRIPMLVILLGAIGGMIAFGIVGLFVGAVVLALGYEIFMAWIGEIPPAAAGVSPPAAEDSARGSRD